MAEELLHAAYLETEEHRIVTRLRNYDACSEGTAYAKKLRARTPQEVWDRCAQPHFMLWWLDKIADQYKDEIISTPRQTSLAVALCRLNLDASEVYYTLVNEVAESNCPDLEGYPSFVIAEHMDSRDRSDSLTHGELVTIRSLIQTEEGNGLLALYNVVESEGVRGCGEAVCRLIREFFPAVPVPTLEQEDEWLENKENDDDY